MLDFITLVKKVKVPIQPTLRLLGAEQCRQIALIHGCDTTRAPLLEASPFRQETRGTHYIDPGGMKGWVNPDQDLNPRPRSQETDPDRDRTRNPAIPSPTR